MRKLIDARGLSCPQPVILTKQALQDSTDITTIVNNLTAKENVSRLAVHEGCEVEVEEKGNDIYLHITKCRYSQAACDPHSDSGVVSNIAGPTILVISSDEMGRGDTGLGDILMKSFIHTLGEVKPQPNQIILFNSGAKLTVKGSPVLEDLQNLQSQGIEVLVCGTCLQFFEIKDQIAVGEISNMYSIAEALLSAGKIVTI